MDGNWRIGSKKGLYLYGLSSYPAILRLPLVKCFLKIPFENNLYPHTSQTDSTHYSHANAMTLCNTYTCTHSYSRQVSVMLHPRRNKHVQHLPLHALRHTHTHIYTNAYTHIISGSKHFGGGQNQ